ncbi:tRNA modification GTPase [Echinicola strongylocentroti]|uniref:tRNA modification GTPase n=1 Tax=Echinicola strongylocentroti TaxID=1795355 RepID=A0A2Z4IMA6_9BACT|nr:tRNA modification GTPase [Echinicola strongylocentroti]AWW31523.1 tRNA modification GTPase [Echinicola strongylocentroti]
MKKLLFIPILIFFAIETYAQISYEEGYYINEAGQKVEGLIKNEDWTNTPDRFDFKRSHQSGIKTISIDSTKEFYIYNKGRYIRSTVNIDRSSDNVTSLSHSRAPLFKRERLFLELLVEGKANLMYYQDSNIRRYFYSVENDSIRQLIYKKFRIDNPNSTGNNENKIGKNSRFRQQLWSDLKYAKITPDKLQRIEYKNKDLVNYFVDYNNWNNDLKNIYQESRHAGDFQLSIRPRINMANLKTESVSAIRGFSIKNHLSMALGLELEYILPGNKRKWSLFIEPTYRQLNNLTTEESSIISGGVLTREVDYKSIEIPAGVRYYLFLNEKSKFYINAALVMDLGFDSSITSTRQDGSIIEKYNYELSTISFAGGIGYKYNNRITVETRYLMNKGLLFELNTNSAYSSFSLIFGYSIF